MSQLSNEAVYDFRNDLALSPKWKFRFDFFEKYGLPGFWKAGSPEHINGLRALSFVDRIKVRMNYFAFFFTFIYLLILGLWRKALLWFGIFFGVGIIEGIAGTSKALNIGISIGICMVIAMRANAYYYQKRVKGQHDWSL